MRQVQLASAPSRLPDRLLTAKTCTCCSQKLPIESFSIKNTIRGTRQAVCRACHAAARRGHYERNRDKVKRRVRARTVEVRLRNTVHVVDHLLANPCVDCGESDPLCLQFDHVRGEKVGNIAALIPYASNGVLATEIAKCEVRCANCHFRRTSSLGQFTRAVVAQRIPRPSSCRGGPTGRGGRFKFGRLRVRLPPAVRTPS